MSGIRRAGAGLNLRLHYPEFELPHFIGSTSGAAFTPRGFLPRSERSGETPGGRGSAPIRHQNSLKPEHMIDFMIEIYNSNI